MVIGLNIDESTIPSPSCDACAEGKMKHHPFPSEASNHSEVPGKRTMTDVGDPQRPNQSMGSITSSYSQMMPRVCVMFYF